MTPAPIASASRTAAGPTRKGMASTSLKRLLLLTCSLTVLAAGQPGLAAPGDGPAGRLGRRGPQWEAMRRQRAEAISRLSNEQRQAFFTELERLEQDRSRERLNQIARLKSCMVQARGLAEVESCQNAMQDSRRQAMQQRRSAMASLRQRFGLPMREGNRRQGLQPGSQRL